MTISTPSSIDPEEVRKFERLAAEWWDPRGKFQVSLARVIKAPQLPANVFMHVSFEVEEQVTGRVRDAREFGPQHFVRWECL